MRESVVALGAGVLFGLGLGVADMTNPAKVQNFLDWLGRFDPSLACVMGSALLVSAVGYRLCRRRTRPWLAETFQIPTRSDLDLRLLGGAALFGVGWGLAGFCPGPALAALSQGRADVLLFCIPMLAGMALEPWTDARLRRSRARS